MQEGALTRRGLPEGDALVAPKPQFDEGGPPSAMSTLPHFFRLASLSSINKTSFFLFGASSPEGSHFGCRALPYHNSASRHCSFLFALYSLFLFP